MRFLGLLVIFSFFGCGDEISHPTPPISEWCDLERPREDCLAESIYINDGDLEAAKALCSTPCTRVKSLSIGGGDAEMFKAVHGFTHIDGLNILSSDNNVRDLNEFKDLTSSFAIWIDGNLGLESLEGLENLVQVAPPEDSEIELTSDYVIKIENNPKLKSVSALKSLKTVGTIDINHNNSLEAVEGLSNLSVGTVRIEYNDALKRISGFESYKNEGAVVIKHNNQLKTIDGFQNLTQADSIYVYRNRTLDECQARRIVDQLVNTPEILEISENGKPCD